MATGSFYIPAKALQSDQGLKEQIRVATGQPWFTRPKAEAEPEGRLWKVCAEAASPRLSGFEWVAFPFLRSLGAWDADLLLFRVLPITQVILR
jgi:hypothetical protein